MPHKHDRRTGLHEIDPNPNGLEAADAALTGYGVEDVVRHRKEEAQIPESKKRSGFLADFLASIVNGISAVPDALATALMVGVNPVYGLYASVLGPTIGSALSSSHLMIVGTTVAASVSAGQAIAGLPEDQKLGSLFTLVILAGIFLIIFGLLKFGRLVKYISYPVMKGFMYGVGLLLIVGQFPSLVGYVPAASNKLLAFGETFINIGSWDWPSVLVAAVTLTVMLSLRNTKLKLFASVLALIAGTLVTRFFGFSSVEIVQDISAIPRGLPELFIPSLSYLTPQLVIAALSLATITAIQGVGVSNMADNPDGSPVNTSRDMVAQGVADVGVGFFSGIPVGASIGSTSLNITVGARSRWAGILTGVWMLLIILFFPSLVEQVPMPALGTLVLVAGFGSVNIHDSKSILKSDWISIWGFLITMAAVIVSSIPVAIGVGFVLSIFFYFVATANRLTASELTPTEKGLRVSDVPEELHDKELIVIEIEGSLFYAAANSLLEHLPRIGNSRGAVVVLRLRNQSEMGATLIDVLDDYAKDLMDAGGRLYLSGLDPYQKAYIEKTDKLTPDEAVLFAETDILAESTWQAVNAAKEWMKAQE